MVFLIIDVTYDIYEATWDMGILMTEYINAEMPLPNQEKSGNLAKIKIIANKCIKWSLLVLTSVCALI